MSERKGTKALELWCKRLVKHCPEVHIENMTTSWRNGMAFCALVHHFRPDLIDMSKLSPENIYENNQLAFTMAEKHLGIPSLLDPEDMVENGVPDRLSVLTYLSQFYQRLGHTVNTKTSESDSKCSPSSSPSIAPFQFGKTELDKCGACEQPVYLAQRLIVSHKLYHRRCFRCSKCSGHMNPKNFEFTQGSDFVCDSCKNEKSLTKFLNNNDQMGMLAFNHEAETSTDGSFGEPVEPKHRPHSILDKISIFEKKDIGIDDKISNMSLTTNNTSLTNTVNMSKIQNDSFIDSKRDDSSFQMKDLVDSGNTSGSLFDVTPEKSYKSNAEKYLFLQTQLVSDAETEISTDKRSLFESDSKNDPFEEIGKDSDTEKNSTNEKELNNVTDDIRIANSFNFTPDMNTKSTISETDPSKTSNDSCDDVVILPPRRKKMVTSPEKVKIMDNNGAQSKKDVIEYPDDLNPFSDDDEEEKQVQQTNLKDASKKETTNPFGSSDEEDDVVLPIPSPPIITVTQNTTPMRRLIAVNPFWSDGEEPTSEDEPQEERPKKPFASALATSTPNLPTGTPRRRKAPAPPPPVPRVPALDPATSMDDDLASLSSLSSHNSTIPDHKSLGAVTPRPKKHLAPTPPGSMYGGSMERGIDSLGNRSHTSDGGSSRVKRPAPGLPLPERRSVKLQMSPEQLQVQLDILETQQMGLERQGVMIERMIRDKCEGDETIACTVPQEEVEDLVIQLCELVNEKNDLFRKQTELMYIRRQQRLEQEQADIEHEIRVIQSRPAVNRIDADKAREEQLVSRLVCIVRMRDELVQQIDAERRRERQEDLAIASSIANKRAQRNSNSAMKPEATAAAAVTTPKKNKVKDKVKKQLKKAKHSLAFKKKEDSEEKDAEKGKKVK